ncbi:hypothetical protein HN747_02845 [archaeon]|jgi:hypothetical protein|nr:hypothetical protein [archaeon]
MVMDLVEMLAEPGQRQAVVAGSAAVLGVGKKVWDVAREMKFSGSRYRLKYAIDKNKAASEFYKSAKIANYINCGSIAIPTFIGMEAAWKSSEPVANNYFIEGLSDLGSAAVGFGAGYIAIPVMIGMVCGMIKGASHVFRKRR